MHPLTAAVLGIGVGALWSRRHTWASRWDCAVTLGLCCQMLNILCMTRMFGARIGSALHAVTGVWNVGQLIGHFLYLFGLGCVLHMTFSRLKLTTADGRRLLRTRLEIPAVLVLGLATPAFVWGSPGVGVPDLALIRPSPMLTLYWAVVGAALLWLASTTVWALLIIRRNPESAKTANIYILASSITLLCLFAGVVDLMIPAGRIVWTLVRVDLAVYATAGAYSWRQRRQTFADLEFPTPA